MNRLLTLLYPAALAAGLTGIAGAALAASHHHPVALAMCALIAAFFGLGAWDLQSFRRINAMLREATLDVASTPETWLDARADVIRGPLRQRLMGQRAVLPGLSLAPALAGMLVLLGMLGTFIGLLLTLGGTAQAMNSTTDLNALRAALGAPVQGLGLAFSASVAGVAGSATLGLMLALARRERNAAVQTLEAALAGPLRPLTAAHREELARIAAEQAAREDAAAASRAARDAQRELVGELQRFAQDMGERLVKELGQHQSRWQDLHQAEQQRFHDEAKRAYDKLASSVDATLRTGLQDALSNSARLAGEAIRPITEATMAGIAREAALLHDRVGQQLIEGVSDLAEQTQHRLDDLRGHFEAGALTIARQLETTAQTHSLALAQQREALAAHFTRMAEQQSGSLQHWNEAQTAQADALLERMADLHADLRSATAATEAERQHALNSQFERMLQAQQQHFDAQHLADAARAAELARHLQAMDAHRVATGELLATTAERSQQSIAGLAQAFGGQADALLGRFADALQQQQAQQQQADTARAAELARQLQALGEQRGAVQELLAESAARTQASADQLAERLSAQTQALLRSLAEAQTRQHEAQIQADAERRAEVRADLAALGREREAAQALLATSGERAQATLAELLKQFEMQTTALVDSLAQSQQHLLRSQQEDEAARLDAWRDALQQAGAHQAAQQQRLADGLLSHTQALVSQAEAQAQATLREAGALLQAAGEAPRAAMDVVAEMREQIVRSQALDQAALAERAELTRTITALLDGLQRAAADQRAAIDSLVHVAADRLDTVGQHFAGQAEVVGAQLGDAAAQLAVGAAEIGAMGQGFGAAVEQFQSTNAQLVQHLQALEERLGNAMTRSDEQLEYYVAQAREVVDLCLGSQKQVLDSLQAAGATHG